MNTNARLQNELQVTSPPMKRLRSIRIQAIAVCFAHFAILQMWVPSMLLACPTCKDGLHDDGTAAAYAFSILFMMGMPFIILSCWVTTIVRLRAQLAPTPTTDSDG